MYFKDLQTTSKYSKCQDKKRTQKNPPLDKPCCRYLPVSNALSPINSSHRQLVAKKQTKTPLMVAQTSDTLMEFVTFKASQDGLARPGELTTVSPSAGCYHSTKHPAWRHSFSAWRSWTRVEKAGVLFCILCQLFQENCRFPRPFPQSFVLWTWEGTAVSLQVGSDDGLIP